MATAEVKKRNNENDDCRGAAKTGTNVREGKPIILSSLRYNKIVNNATSTERVKALAEAEEEQRLKDQLKAGNDHLVAQFKGNMQRTQEQKLEQIKEQSDKKHKQAVVDFEHAKENEDQKRQEKIAKAKQIMERLKPGPRELHSAVLQSEVLRARNVQRNINEEYEKAIQKQDYETKNQCEVQAMSWIGEEQQRLNERKKLTLAYKQELLKTIRDNESQRSEQKKQMIKEQQAARDVTDGEIKAQIEKEKAIMEKKRAALRKNALEAMKMVEQRRLRDRMVEEVEDRLCCVYNAGKKQMDNLRAEQTKKLAADQQKKIEDEVKKLSTNEDKARAIENERVRRDISTKQLKFTAEEQEKVRKDKAAKQARIEAYLKEMEEKKELQRRFDEEKRFEMAQRFKNSEINCMFNEAHKNEQTAQILDVRKQLTQQMEQNKLNKLAQKQANISCVDDNLDKEHKFFFDHAHNLMEDAKQKGRPLYPFVKVVQQYKRDNLIECDRKLPKHLESQVPIGDKTVINKNKDKTSASEENSTKASVLQNCLKITELIKSEKNMPSNNLCLPQKSSKDGGGGDSLSVSSSQLRYSMQELKKMNQFAAPTCH